MKQITNQRQHIKMKVQADYIWYIKFPYQNAKNSIFANLSPFESYKIHHKLRSPAITKRRTSPGGTKDTHKHIQKLHNPFILSPNLSCFTSTSPTHRYRKNSPKRNIHDANHPLIPHSISLQCAAMLKSIVIHRGSIWHILKTVKYFACRSFEHFLCCVSCRYATKAIYTPKYEDKPIYMTMIFLLLYSTSTTTIISALCICDITQYLLLDALVTQSTPIYAEHQTEKLMMFFKTKIPTFSLYRQKKTETRLVCMLSEFRYAFTNDTR